MYVCTLASWEEEFLAPSVARSTMEAFILCVVWITMASLMRSLRIRIRTLSSLLLVKLHTQDFAGSISLRTSKVFGTDQPSLNYGYAASHETCVPCLSSYAQYWISVDPVNKICTAQ